MAWVFNGLMDDVRVYRHALTLEELQTLIHGPASRAGDLNSDGFVGQDDLNIILGNWGQTVTANDPMSGDPSGDGFVGQDDLNEVLGGWGQGTLPVALNAVPEPQSVTHLAISFIGLSMVRRRALAHRQRHCGLLPKSLCK
jgi:hypothetical protein